MGFGVIFGDPWFLLLLPALALFCLWRARRPRATLDGGSEELLAHLPGTLRAGTAWLPAALLIAGAVLLIVALARPMQGREESRIQTEGIDIMLVVDTSGSMLEANMEQGVTNIELVKQVVGNFVKGRKDDRIGLLSFAKYPRTECPPTLDMGGLQAHLADVHCVRVNSEEDGTGIGVGLGKAASLLKPSDAKSKVVVLLTDGLENQHVVDPLDAAQLCRSLGIRVYTIGVGRRLVRPTFGPTMEQPLDTSLLEAIAATTDGRFYRARDADTLASVYAEIDKLERSKHEDVRYTDYDDLYPWLLVPAVLLLAIELLLRRGPYLEVAS